MFNANSSNEMLDKNKGNEQRPKKEKCKRKFDPREICDTVSSSEEDIPQKPEKPDKEPKPKPKPEEKPEEEPEKKPEKPAKEPKPEPKPEEKPEEEPEKKPEKPAKEPKPEPKPEEKPEKEPEKKPEKPAKEPKPEPKPEEKPEEEPEKKPEKPAKEPKPEPKPEEKPEKEPEKKPEKPAKEPKPEPKPEEKPEKEPEKKPEKPAKEPKPEPKPEEKPEEEPEKKPERPAKEPKPEEKPDEKPQKPEKPDKPGRPEKPERPEEPQKPKDFDLTWVESHAHKPTPECAIRAGNDSDGTPIYIGRAYCQGDLIPGKVIQNVVYVSQNGGEFSSYSYEVLCGSDNKYDWFPAFEGCVPPNAVVGGYTESCEDLYVGRGRFADCIIPGKVHPSHKCLYIPHKEREVHLKDYEVLVRRLYPNSADLTWVQSHVNKRTPECAIRAGSDSDGTPIYIGRAFCQGDLIPGKLIQNVVYVGHSGREFSSFFYEVLCGGDNKYDWLPAFQGGVPPNAVAGGYTKSGEGLYVGRVRFADCIIPGKVHPSHKCLYILHKEREVRIESYHVLVRR